jgi:hypothetical protein
MRSGGMSAPFGAGIGGRERVRSGRPRPHVSWEQSSDAHRTIPPGRISQSSHQPDNRVNVKGAIPLLLIGGFAVAYSIVLELQSTTLPGTRLPIWLLVLVAGAMIFVAGIFSLFWAEVEEDQSRPRTEPIAVEAIDPRVSKGRAESIPLRSTSPAATPPWWEGPPTEPVSTHGHPAAAPRVEVGPVPVRVSSVLSPPHTVIPVSRGSTVVAPESSRLASPSSVPAQLAPGATRAPSSLRGSFPKEFMEALSELETLADRELTIPSRPPPKSGQVYLRTCADCKREISSKERSPNRCADCGRGLCSDCAKSSRLEDAELRCIECRVRGP